MKQLPWLADPLARVLKIHEQGRLPHAMLIRANEGWGEAELANRLTLTLLERTEIEDARTLAHPDLKWVQPEGSVIKVDDIRELAGFAIGTRQSAPCKVAVVEAADLMNQNAANALLKTLEEPPADTYVLLTTCRPARLLPTIVSRCQTVTIDRDAGAAREWLLEHWAEADIEAKLFESGEAPLTVHQALVDEEPDLGGLLQALAERSPVTSQVGSMLDWNVDRLTAGWYRHCIALLAGASRLPQDAPVGSADAVDRSGLVEFVDELKAVRYQLLMTNSANQRLLYERLAARWYGLFTVSGRRTR